MTKLCTSEGNDGVTTIASQLGRKVRSWLNHIRPGQLRAANMAASAIAWRPPEYATHVTGLTADVGMRARQRKTGPNVVEVARCRLRQKGSTEH